MQPAPAAAAPVGAPAAAAPVGAPAAAAPAKAAGGLDPKLKHFGSFVNWRGQAHDAYLVHDSAIGGLVAKCAKTHRAFKSVTHDKLPAHRCKFVGNGKTEAVK